MNNVETLKNINFSSLSLERNLDIKSAGRPTPELHITRHTKSKNKDVVRKFRPRGSVGAKLLIDCFVFLVYVVQVRKAR